MKLARHRCTRLSFLVLVGSAHAQVPWRTTEGAQPRERVGLASIRLGDLDGDGLGEYGIGHARGVRIHRGSDGALLRDVQRAEGLAGDVDGDGTPDFWAAVRDGINGEWTSTDVLSGATGAIVAQWPWSQVFGPWGTSFGEPIAFSDVTLDGHADFLRVDKSQSGYQAVLCSGADGSILRSYPTDGGCAPLDDFDGDGVDDYLVTGRPFFTSSPPPRVLSGATGATLATLGMPPFYGWDLATLDDVDGDSVRDLVYTDWGMWGSVATKVLSSRSGVTLAVFPEMLLYGNGAESPHGDFDGDGTDDVALVDLATKELVVRSIATGAIVQRCDVFASSCAGLGDLDGDGRSELLVGLAHARAEAGRAIVVRGNYGERVGTAFGFGDGSQGPCPCSNAPTPGTGCANSFGIGARLQAWGSTSLAARDLFLLESGHWRDANLLGWSFLVASPSALATPTPCSGGLLALGGPKSRIAKTRLWSWDLPSVPEWSTWVPAQTVNFQVWYRDGDAVYACGLAGNLTNALAITFTP